MRHVNRILIIGFILLAAPLLAQDSQEVKVPLSNPGEDGMLHLNVLNGSINVKGYNGNSVVIKVKTSIRNKGENNNTKNGLRRITSNSAGFTAEEYNNLVVVKSSWSNSVTDFDIHVPQNFSLKLSTVNNGDIYVENVKGEFEVTNTNGAITMNKVSGSVVADALNDDIKITFEKVTADVPMAFSSLNGNVDITFPPTVKANISAKTDNGEVLTDFEMETIKSEPKITSRNNSGVYKVKSEKGVFANINGGGARFTFKSLNGDIIIRSKK